MPEQSRDRGAQTVRLLLAILFALSALLAWAQDDATPAPTPEQRFFDWTDLSFPPEVYAQRRDRLIHALRESGGGIYLAPASDGRSHGETFRQNSDFLYFTGLELPSSILAVDSNGRRATLFVPERDARFESTGRANDFPGRPLGDDPELRRRSGIRVRPFRQLAAALTGWVEAGRPLRVNLSLTAPLLATDFIYSWSPEEKLAHHLQERYPEAEIRGARPHIAGLRMVKSSREIAALRRAVAATEMSIRKAARAVREGVDERTLEAEFEAECKRQGAQRLAFASIVKSGPNSLWPWRILASHYDRRNRRMQAGDLVIFDVGCEVDHYSSDVGRTFPVAGRFDAEQKKILEMVTGVADAIIAATRPGTTFGELKEIALAALPEEHRKYMQTGSFFGHHIGLDVGDPSLLEQPLEAGMVFTVEPWYYNHDRGIAVFVEDDILVTAEGRENMSHSLPRSPAGLERLMRDPG